MSKKSDGLLAELMDNRWSYTDTRTNATLTAQMIGAPQSAKDTVHLDFFHMAILNKNTLSFTMAAQIRDASVAGTVLAQWPLLLVGSQVAQVAPAGINLKATQGKGFFITTDTVQPSVTATVNSAGWTDQSTDY